VTSDADEAFARQLYELRREYLADSPKRLAELRALSARLAAGDTAALAECRQAFHRLAGSGGSYGFPLVSTRSREGEHLIQRLASTASELKGEDLAAFSTCVDAVAHAFEEAAASFARERHDPPTRA
jgi:chemotaxis protein histidine kinase CheA